MEKKYLEKIEFNKILEILKNFAITLEGKKLCLDLLPSSNENDVKHLISETTEAVILKARKGLPPIAEIDNISAYIKILESENSLSTAGLLSLAHILKISRELKEYISQDIEVNFAPITVRYFNNLYSNPKIESRIFSCIIDENTIDDNASSTLASLRRNRRKLEQDIKKNLSNLLNSKFIQEPIVTIRNDRFVIPVKAEYRSEIKGLIHDMSASGSTVFIEPFSVFEINNKINSLKVEENLEIEKILENLSSLFFGITEDLENNVRLISMIDFAFAKAKYAESINATEPIINSEKFINLKNARHPLIDKAKVVPINISIGKKYTSLIITGPNTGGKTVTLKTVALLEAMAMSGLHIPTSEKSSVYVFKKLFVDIGDEQSIAESLSTFSAHITNIVKITNNVDSESLVVIDELGSGTDPIQGANLGISILDFLHNTGCITLATTHYPEIKNYALTTNGFENASSEFDLNTLSPTYRLLLGVPGKSMAFEIGKKLGLNEKILENAQSKMDSNHIDTEELLKNIYNDKSTIEKEKEKILKQSAEIEELKNSLSTQKNKQENEYAEIINNAKSEAKSILLSAKKEADSIIKELSNSKNVNKLRNDLNDKIKSITPEANNTRNSLSLDDIKLDMNVFVNTFGQEGIIVSKPNKGNNVIVQIGNAKMQVNIKNLSPAKHAKPAQAVVTPKVNSNLKARTATTEINVLGYNVDEATFVIDKFLDDCALAHIQTARIVHGKGTGALRSGIHTFLRKHPHVATFRLGTFRRRRNGSNHCGSEIEKQQILFLISAVFLFLKI